MLSKAKAFSKVFQASSRVSALTLQKPNKIFFATSAPSSYDLGVGSQVGSKSTEFVAQKKTVRDGEEKSVDYILKLYNQLQSDKAIPAYLKASDYLTERHLGPDSKEIQLMLNELGVKSLEELMKLTVPQRVLDPEPFKHPNGEIPEAVPEKLLLEKITKLAQKNKLYKCYIGGGYYDTITPEVVKRNVLENPNWYTAYTPYQAEISQGRLETLLNYQTLMAELTGLQNSNSSLLDEATSCAEAMTMCFANNSGKNTFFVSSDVFPQSLAVMKTRAENVGINLVVGDIKTFNFDAIANDLAGILLQTPDVYGVLHNYTDLITKIRQHNKDLGVVIACDPLALLKTVTPAEMGADIAVGSAQRFGVPMGFGGPHASFMVAKESLVRKIPGRIIGVSKDAFGNRAYRLTLQTREQHIKREKASSNICTAQVLLANISALYAVYHGKEGLKNIATRVNALTQIVANQLSSLGYVLKTSDNSFFDTITINTNAKDAENLLNFFIKHEINLGKIGDNMVRVSLSEATTLDDVKELVTLFAEYKGEKINVAELFRETEEVVRPYETSLARKDEGFLQQEIFNTIHSEHQMLRYMQMLISKDISLTKSMIALGSCTMKLNATTEMRTISIPEISLLHPFTPKEQTEGYLELLDILKKMLRSITKFDEFSLQPNSGAQGEYAGLSTIIAYQKSVGQGHRDICLIPQSAHGTNPASAVMCGLKVVVVKSDEHGNVDLKDLKEKAEAHKDNLSCLMITYPSTHGVYEDTVIDALKIIHNCGGQVYMDGANMNAQVGWTSPAFLGADVCHLNMHKTFCIPHGGGGPGMGPIGVKAHLAPFLPLEGSGSVAAAPYGSASILPISIAYIWGLGAEGLKQATAVSILAANYLANRLKDHYKLLYRGQNGKVAHEFILDIRPIKAKIGITEEDIAKRLADYGFHAPTVSFPVAGTLMIEPTESEDKGELDRFADALIKIREEIKKVEDGVWDKKDNPLKNAPHPADHVLATEWNHCYSREEAAYPLAWIKTRGKYWPPVGRVDNAFGDRNLVCTCAPTSEYF